MNLLAFIVLGLIAGAVAKMIYPGTQGGGIFATMALGVVGAFIGGTLHTFITTGQLAVGAVNAGFWTSLAIAVVGAMLAIFIWGLLTRKSA
jgi:uncharacterized membrane protein YeaQ/YmgE (transglycosylase-associated protein family)